MANSNILVSRTNEGVTTGVPTSEFVVNTQVITNTTTVEQKLNDVITNVGYIPYMRALPIEFVAGKLRPLRQSYYYFDDEPISQFVQKPNIIELNKRVSINGLIDGARDTIKIGSSVANILHIETNENTGNTKVYVANWQNPASIAVGASVTSTSNNSLSASVVSYEHHSGKLRTSTLTDIVLALDASTADNYYTGNVLTIVSGTNAGESREIVGYTGSTRTAHLSQAFTAADVNSVYSIGDRRSSWSANTTQAHFVTSRGYMSGIFYVPDPSQSEVKFRTGDRIFRILDNPRNDNSVTTSSAEYRFVANGLDLTKAQIIQKTTYNSSEEIINIINQPTPTPTPTQTISVTPSQTPGVTATATPSQTPGTTSTITPTPTITDTPGPTYTPTLTPTRTPGSSATPSPTVTPTATLSATQTVTPSVSPTPGVSPTPTLTPSATVTPTVTFTATNTQTPAASLSSTPTPTQTQSLTMTPTHSPTPTVTNTQTPTQTVSITPTPTKTVTPTKTPLPPCDVWRQAPMDARYGPNLEDLVTFLLRPNAEYTGQTVTVNYSVGIYSYEFKVVSGRWNFGKWTRNGTTFTVTNTDTGEICYDTLAWEAQPQGDPIAQTFFVATRENPNGLYISSVDLFFKNKGDLLPVQVEIRPVVNGIPSSDTVIPGAICIKEPEDIRVSDLPNTQNSMTATKFTFSSPVYLNSGYEYAIVVITDDYGYDYYVAEKGNPALGSGVIASQQAFLGSLFKSQNARTWTPYQNEDMMFTLNRASFNKFSGEIILNEDKNSVSSVASGNTVFDALEIHSDAIELVNTKLTYKYKSTTNSSGTFASSYSEVLPDKKTDMSDRQVILPANNASKSIEVSVALTTVDEKISPVLFHNRQSVVAIENRINNSSLSDNRVKIIDGGSGYSSNASITFSSTVGYGANAWGVANGTTGQIDRIVFDSYGAGYVDDVTATLTGSGTGAQIQIISETGKSGGPAEARYISKTVTLLDGFDAGDLRIFLTAVKPPGSNVQVYYKVRNSLDSDQIDDRNWVRMVQKTSEYTYSLNKEAIEYEYRPSLSSNNIVYSTDTTTYKTFNQFAVKVVLSSTGTTASKIPYVYDMRAIALPGDVY